jgi:tetratricopeptide (TPR) repeat protein
MSIDSVTDYQKKIIVILVLVLLNLAVYWQVQNFGFVYYDDDIYVTRNDQIKSGVKYETIIYAFMDTHTANWHPLTMLSHMLDWQLYGDKAGGHHWSSLILHIINTVLLFLLLNRMTGAVWRSAFVAALFAVHPINVESVAWVAERKNVLSTFFWILTMLFYVWYVKQPTWKKYLPVLICFALGLMSKPMLVTLPFVLLLMDYWPLNRTSINTLNEDQTEIQPPFKSKKAKWSFLLLEKIPLFILTAISICVTLYAQHSVGAMMRMHYLSLSRRISNAIVSYGLYIKKMFWPLDLSLFYPLYSVGLWKLLSVSFFLILLSAIALRYYRKHPYLLVGWLWFLGTLVPVIGMVQVGAQAMADRYAYVPFIGLFIILAWYVADVAGKNTYIKYGLALTSFLIVLALSLLSWQRCQLWGDQIALWDDVLKKNQVDFAYNFRGLAYVDKGQYRLAMADYNAAIVLDKTFVEAFNNRANLYIKMGRYSPALQDFNEALRHDPKYFNAYYNRGILHLRINELDAAISDFTQAINCESDIADAFNKRGVAFSLKGHYEKAFADFNQALKLNHNFAEAYFNRGVIYHLHQQYIPAIANFSEALRIRPDYVDARFSRGVSFAALGKHDLAVKDFNNVLKIDSRHINALKKLGIVLKNMERYDESSIQYGKILQIKPDDQDALQALSELKRLKK